MRFSSDIVRFYEILWHFKGFYEVYPLDKDIYPSKLGVSEPGGKQKWPISDRPTMSFNLEKMGI